MLWEDAGPILKQSHKRIDALTFEQEAASVCVCVSVGKEIPIIITSGVTYC